jgi:hypothetical protein
MLAPIDPSLPYSAGAKHRVITCPPAHHPLFLSLESQAQIRVADPITGAPFVRLHGSCPGFFLSMALLWATLLVDSDLQRLRSGGVWPVKVG